MPRGDKEVKRIFDPLSGHSCLGQASVGSGIGGDKVARLIDFKKEEQDTEIRRMIQHARECEVKNNWKP